MLGVAYKHQKSGAGVHITHNCRTPFMHPADKLPHIRRLLADKGTGFLEFQREAATRNLNYVPRVEHEFQSSDLRSDTLYFPCFIFGWQRWGDNFGREIGQRL